MLKYGLYFLLLTLVTPKLASADEPARKQIPPLKQRVSPQVLREAMALPEYQGKSPESSQKLLDELQALAEKLSRNGDESGANLLQRFINDHRQLTERFASLAASDGKEMMINFQVIDVNMEQLPLDSMLRSDRVSENSTEIQKELDSLVSQKIAKREKFSLVTHTNQVSRIVDGGEFPVPTPSTDGKTTISFREYGKNIECMATTTTADRVRLRVKIEFSEKDQTNSIELQGTTVPGRSVRSFLETFEVRLGDVSIHSFHTKASEKTFLTTVVTHHNIP